MKKSAKEICEKELPEFVAEVSGLDVEALKVRLSVLAQGRADNARAKEGDEALEQARATASELAAPYRDAEKVLKLKSRYIADLIKGE
jgi:hypothetical protein